MCLDKGLYDKVDINENQIEDFRRNFLCLKGKFDAYCIECIKESHFEGQQKNLSHNLSRGAGLFRGNVSIPPPGASVTESASNPDPILNFIRNGSVDYEFKCARNCKHKMVFHFRLKDNSLFKIGQYPSVADLQLPSIHKYRKQLTNDDYLELAKAVGLNAHGIGIGSFVYLRRIFERLIENAHTQAKEGSGWNEETYSKSRIVEKIELLQKYLPEFLVENKSLYGLLSKGIHELGENECKQVFPIVRTGIELILDEKIAKAEREKKLATVSKQISGLHQQYNS